MDHCAGRLACGWWPCHCHGRRGLDRRDGSGRASGSGPRCVGREREHRIRGRRGPSESAGGLRLAEPSSPASRLRLLGPLRWVLFASLALNLLVLGLLLGALLDGGPGRGPRSIEMALGPIVRALDEEDRNAILGSLRQRPDLRPPRREERAAALAEIVESIRAEPFDPERAGQALAAQSGRVAELQAAVQAALLDRLQAMTSEQRQSFASGLEEELRNDRPHGGDR
ncbi:periplasmic heavy metal sensor [Rubellimicrobium rubrum]|uniref:Periplasmic heavy metal sensor n=1 Tax=Rubellimicrobium rubrum TaxID=2585369 RepID=A0A5C4N0M4_9RHOB|nr:periplasmic heavy metal sensor [Rubellimicrobium rubrum]